MTTHQPLESEKSAGYTKNCLTLEDLAKFARNDGKELDLTKVEVVDDHLVDTISRGFPELESISMTSITKESARKLIEQCEKLKEIFVSRTKKDMKKIFDTNILEMAKKREIDITCLHTF